MVKEQYERKHRVAITWAEITAEIKINSLTKLFASINTNIMVLSEL